MLNLNAPKQYIFRHLAKSKNLFFANICQSQFEWHKVLKIENPNACLPPPIAALLLPWMKEEKGIRHRGGGGLPTLPSLKLSTFQPSQRGFFWVHTCVWRERKPEAKFSNFSGPQASIPQNWQIGFGNPLSSCYTRTTIYAGGIDSLEIFALFKSLKIRALENYVSLLRHTFTHS